jgi:hypothetical protein
MESDLRHATLCKYEPHWLWAPIFLVTPLVLTTLGVLGIPVGSAISIDVRRDGFGHGGAYFVRWHSHRTLPSAARIDRTHGAWPID